MKKTIAIVLLLILSMNTNAQKTDNVSIAQKAFDTWQIGEKTGSYKDFKLLLNDNFKSFSHPLLGTFKNDEARFKLRSLVAERELKSNNLDFTEIQLINNRNQYVFLFNSSGTVSGGFPYQGFNAIVIRVEKGNLTGFREFFGFVDPNWFKN